MRKHNPNNERIKRQYFAFLKEAMRHSEDTVDAAAKAISRFETYNKWRDFRTFHHQQAVAFKAHLTAQHNVVTGVRLSKATLHATLTDLKRFVRWLSGQPGYKSRFCYADAEYFNLSAKDTRAATAKRDRPSPTLAQIRHVLERMPRATEIELRNRALVAFTLLTGARDSAIASMKLKHIDLAAGSVYQDAREVKTKASKSFTTYFFQVGNEICEPFTDWVNYLLTVKLWGNDDPLFPATHIGQDANLRFVPRGVRREHWRSASPIREIFRDAFKAAGLPYFNPHSFRKTLAQLAGTLCHTAEEYKAWSQNLGHDGVLTTFLSYGEVGTDRQREIIESLAKPRAVEVPNASEIAKAVARELHISRPTG